MTLKTRLLAAGTAILMAQAAPAQEAELVWWTMNWNEEKANDFARQFMEEHPDVSIRVEPNVYGGLQSRILVALRSGDVPDLIDVPNGINIPLAETGQLAPIGEALAAKGVDYDDILPASVGTATYEGKVYGLPFQAEAHGFVYNKQHYRDAGLDPERPPETWAEFLAYSQKLTGDFDGEQRYGYGVSGGGPDQPGNAVFRSLPFLWMNDGGILAEDDRTVIINSPESVEAVKFYTDLYKVHQVSPPSTLENDSAALRRLFTVGSLSQIPAASSDVGRIAEAAPESDIGVGILPHPEGKDTAAVLGGWNFVIPKNSEHMDIALELATFMAEPSRQAVYTTTFPAARAGLELAQYDDPSLDAHKEMLNYARPQPTIPEWSEIGQIYFNHLQEVLLGGDAQEEMDAAAETIEAVLQNASQ